MSIRVMSAIWDLDLPDSEKLVALALADWCNDDGECWPSVPQIAKKCSKSERTVQNVTASLEAKGHLSRNMIPGRGCKYHLHPRKCCTTTPAAAAPVSPRSRCTPAKSAPVQGTTDTPAAAAPNTSVTVISSEAKASSESRAPAKPNEFPRPQWADASIWADFMSNRKRKRLPSSATAYRGFLRDIDEQSDQRWTPDRLLEHAAAKGWGSIHNPDKQDRNHGSAPRPVQPAPDGRSMGRTEAAGRAALARIAVGGN